MKKRVNNDLVLHFRGGDRLLYKNTFEAVSFDEPTPFKHQLIDGKGGGIIKILNNIILSRLKINILDALNFLPVIHRIPQAKDSRYEYRNPQAKDLRYEYYISFFLNHRMAQCFLYFASISDEKQLGNLIEQIKISCFEFFSK